MRMFNANQRVPSAEDEAAKIRLMAIAHRSKAGRSPEKTTQALPQLPDAPEDSEIER